MSRTRRLAAGALLLALLLLLTGCSTWLNLLSTLGYDTNDYASEPVLNLYEEDSEPAAMTMERIGMLLLDSETLKTFTNSSEAIDLYQDAVLNSLLCDNYARYAGNADLLERIEKKYPGTKCSAFIPASEYESRAYTIFGGSWKMSNHSSELFTYLEEEQGYLLITVFRHPAARAVFLSLSETEHTFRLRFKVIVAESVSPVYEALFFKRDDGTIYFRTLTSQ
ncbi:MAG: hypothetical protein II797_04670 [Clostridia bacterium]|nr:hypothetical protein [Clostridia bacterium]